MKNSPAILLIGQCTLHWGRMEFGNIGNYYILEPLIRQLHQVFPGAKIRTTMQLSGGFCKSERVECLPMEAYYSWSGSDLADAQAEVEIAKMISRKKSPDFYTRYIQEVLSSDIVIDFSGDIWGANADFLGKDRFQVGLCKDLIPQILGKPVAMIAGSPGPFSDPTTLELAREVYAGFSLVTNRENLSTPLLKEYGFDVSRTQDCACPSFLFEPKRDEKVESVIENCRKKSAGRPLVGFIVCGWNFVKGPFQRWPRSDDELAVFVQAAKRLIDEGATVVFMSHSNGFNTPPSPFELIHGRDYPIAERLCKLTQAYSRSQNALCIDDVLLPAQTKAVIGSFDMLVSGRIHGAVAGLSQSVPTAIIDYGHEPKAHKLRGFAEMADVLNCVADPAGDMNEVILNVFRNRASIRMHLNSGIPQIRSLAKRNFDLLKALI